MDGPGEMMQGVRMLTALPEDLNSVPSTDEEQLTKSIFSVLLVSAKICTHMTFTHTDTYT